MRVCAQSDLDENEGLKIDTTPPVSVFLAEGEVFCIDDTCTHEDYSLAEGWVEGCVVECALHQARFDLRTGASTPPAGAPVRVHPVRVDADGIHVSLPVSYTLPEGAE